MNPSAIPNTGYSFTPYGAGGVGAINNAQGALSAPTQVQADPAQAPQKGNWFTHLLPTIGSFAGMAGAPIAAALAPETGGLSLLAELALAGAGSAAGKATEDAVQGQSVNAGDLLKSAGEGALGQGIGHGISSLAGIAGGAVKGTLGNAVAGRAAQTEADAATQAAADAATNKATLYGEGVKAAKDPSIGANFQSTLDNAEKNYGIDTSQTNAPQLMSEVGHAQTGGNIENGQGALNEKVDQIINNHGGNVNLGSIGDELNQSVGDLNSASGTSGTLDQMIPKGKTLAPANNPAQQAVQQIAQLSPKLTTSGGTGLTASEMSSSEADSLAKGLQKIAFSKVPTSTTGFQDPVALAKQKIANDLYNYVRGEVDNQPGLSDAVQSLKIDPDLEKYIDSKVSNISDPNVQALAKQKLMQTFQGANRVQDLRAAQADAVQLSKLGDQVHGFNSERTYTTSAPKRAAVGSPPPPSGGNGMLDTAAVMGAPFTHGLSLVGLLPHVLNMVKSPAAQEMGDKLLNSGVSKNLAKTLPSVLTGASQFITHAPDSAANPVNLNLGNNNMNPQENTDPNGLNSLLLKLAAASIANNNPAGSSLMNAILPNMQNANVAQNSLTGAENAFQQAGGGQGGVLGNLSKLLGGITGNPASQYEQQRSQLINQLTPLGIPTSAVPDITGNNQSAQNQFQTLQQMINARLNGGSLSAIPTQ